MGIGSFVEAYTVNGLAMEGPQYAIESVQNTTPALRGSNSVSSLRHGVVWQRKRFDPSSESWLMWISDLPSTGAPYSSVAASRAQYRANYDDVIEALNRDYVGSRNYTDLSGSSVAEKFSGPIEVISQLKSSPSSPSDIYRVNYGEVSGGMLIPDYKEFGFSRFNVQVVYADPRWYECASTGAKTYLTQTLSVASGNTDDVTGTSSATAAMTKVQIKVTGSASMTNFVLENVTTGSVIKYTGTIGTSQNLLIDTNDYTVKLSGTLQASNVDRVGSDTLDWWDFRPGVNNTVRGTWTGGGTADIEFRYARAFL